MAAHAFRPAGNLFPVYFLGLRQPGKIANPGQPPPVMPGPVLTENQEEILRRDGLKLFPKDYFPGRPGEEISGIQGKAV